jgi:hypothetical protein
MGIRRPGSCAGEQPAGRRRRAAAALRRAGRSRARSRDFQRAKHRHVAGDAGNRPGALAQARGRRRRRAARRGGRPWAVSAGDAAAARGTGADYTGVLLTLRRRSGVAPSRRRSGDGAGQQRRLGTVGGGAVNLGFAVADYKRRRRLRGLRV